NLANPLNPANSANALNPLNLLNPVNPVNPVTPVTLGFRQSAHGCTREEIELLIKPMIADAHEAVGSMGDDAPPAALSSRSRLFTDFFRQRFAQVTNPPVDPRRESPVMSRTTLIGAQGSYLDETAARPPRVALRSPVLTCAQRDQLYDAALLAPVMIDTLFDPNGGAPALEERLAAIADEAASA